MISATLAVVPGELVSSVGPVREREGTCAVACQRLVLPVLGHACLYAFVEQTVSSACPILLSNVVSGYRPRSDWANCVPFLSSWPHLELYVSLDVVALLSV